jgi:methylthioribulose-1-phosphate dehydratase
MGMHDTLTFGSEEDLTESLEAAMEKYPDAYAVLVRRHGM